MKKIIEFFKRLFPRLRDTAKESVKDPEIMVAVATPSTTKVGLIAKIVFISGQVFDNFRKSLKK